MALRSAPLAWAVGSLELEWYVAQPLSTIAKKAMASALQMFPLDMGRTSEKRVLLFGHIGR
jgi:hypothetical protein